MPFCASPSRIRSNRPPRSCRLRFSSFAHNTLAATRSLFPSRFFALHSRNRIESASTQQRQFHSEDWWPMARKLTRGKQAPADSEGLRAAASSLWVYSGWEAEGGECRWTEPVDVYSQVLRPESVATSVDLNETHVPYRGFRIPASAVCPVLVPSRLPIYPFFIPLHGFFFTYSLRLSLSLVSTVTEACSRQTTTGLSEARCRAD